jgi:hypothetical protein
VENGRLAESWRNLLNEALNAPTDELARMLVRWESPGDELGQRIDQSLEAALRGEQTALTVLDDVDAEAEVGAEAEVDEEDEAATLGEQATDSVNRLLERVTELEELVDELEDVRVRVRADADRGAFGWLGPFRHIGRGIAGVLSILVTGAVIFGIAFAAIFFGGRRYIEAVADTARRSTMRSLLVGLAATFLLIPAWILGMIALAISIVGIPALLVWIPLFPVAAGLAVLLGYIAVAHALGESLAERRFYASDWFQRGNSYYFIMSGLALLLALFVCAQIVSMAGPWLGFFRGALTALGVVVTWAALSVGFGAVLMSRAGTRAVHAPGSPEPEIYAEETRV